MTPSGYETMHRLALTAPADMLESVAGYQPGEEMHKELIFATRLLDENDPDSLRWLACLCERRVADLEASL